MRGFVCSALTALRSPGTGEKHSTVKRKIALHLGYVGTKYKGLQFQRTSCQEGIEDVLETAIAKSGGILPSNVGHGGRTKWSRSSRTDKGVHSISTVVALNMECEDEFQDDREGQKITAAINKHLPAEIKVFSAQRTHSSFSARYHCQDRTYQYFLPAKILGLNGSTDDVAALDRLQAALEIMKGKHAFHNFTERQKYRTKRKDGDARKGAKSSVEGPQELPVLPPALEGAILSREPSPSFPNRLTRPLSFRWIKDEPGREWDQIGDAHYRTILEARATLCGTLDGLSQPCICVSLQGTSFMVYQIRHIIGFAVAVANELLPLEFVEASLSIHTRCTLPKAPSSSLLLSDSAFFPFPMSSGAPHPVCSISGPSLALRPLGLAQQTQFRRKVLNKALNELLHAKEWDEWLEELDSTAQYNKDEMENFLGAFRNDNIAKRAASEDTECNSS